MKQKHNSHIIDLPIEETLETELTETHDLGDYKQIGKVGTEVKAQLQEADYH